MKAFIHIFFALILVATTTATFANNNNKSGDKETAKDKATIYDKAPVMDKKVCDLKLKFDANITGTNIEFANQSVGTYTNIEWTFGDGNTSTEKNPTHTYAKDGVYYYTVTLYNADNGCIDFFAGNQYVGQQPTTTNASVVSAE